jgi:hypothetical protein
MLADYTIYFVISCLGICSSIFVAVSLFLWGSFSVAITHLLFWLHISLIAEEVTLLPFVFSYSSTLCVAAQFFHYYFGMMNVIVVFQLVDMHRYYLLGGIEWIREIVRKYGPYFFVIFPIISVIPYITQAHNWTNSIDDDSGWCVESTDEAFSSIVAYYYVWVWLFLFASICMVCYTVVCVLKADKNLASKYISTVGLMTLISILGWIPRSIEQISSIGDSGNHEKHRMVSLLPIPISGICFGLLFYFFERPNLSLLKGRLFAPPMVAALGAASTDSSDHRGSFSWEISSLAFLQNLALEDEGSVKDPDRKSKSRISAYATSKNSRLSAISNNNSISRRSEAGASFVSSLSEVDNPIRKTSDFNDDCGL